MLLLFFARSSPWDWWERESLRMFRQSISINKTSVGIYSFCFSRKSQVSCERDKKRRPPRLSIYSPVNMQRSSLHLRAALPNPLHLASLVGGRIFLTLTDSQGNFIYFRIMTDLSQYQNCINSKSKLTLPNSTLDLW